MMWWKNKHKGKKNIEALSSSDTIEIKTYYE